MAMLCGNCPLLRRLNVTEPDAVLTVAGWKANSTAVMFTADWA